MEKNKRLLIAVMAAATLMSVPGCYWGHHDRDDYYYRGGDHRHHDDRDHKDRGDRHEERRDRDRDRGRHGGDRD